MRRGARCAEAEKINKPQEPGTPHSHRWFKQSLDLLKPEARLARALVELDSGRAVAPQTCSRHSTLQRNTPSRSSREPRCVYVANPKGGVSYFTHSREFFALNDGVPADLGGQLSRRSRPRRPGSNCCSDDGRLRSCGNFKSISPNAGTSFIALMFWLHKRARCDVRHER